MKTKCYQREDKIKGRPSCQHVEINVDVCSVPLVRGSSQISLEIPRADKRIEWTKNQELKYFPIVFRIRDTLMDPEPDPWITDPYPAPFSIGFQDSKKNFF